jgi:GMP synthase (glutamine-hydrolysing)
MLKAAGFRIRYVNFGRHPDLIPDIDGYSGLIILGGPMGVYEADRHRHLKVEMQIIEKALKKNIPVLGICLGAQLIASVLGSEVKKAPQIELGWHELHLTDAGKKDRLFTDFQASEKVFQMHQDMFEPPMTCEHLAFTQLIPGQAFRYGEKVYGLQFHLEADLAMILRWLNRTENKKWFLHSGDPHCEENMQIETNQLIAQSLKLSHSAFSKFIEIFNLPAKKILLGSDHAKPLKKV